VSPSQIVSANRGRRHGVPPKASGRFPGKDGAFANPAPAIVAHHAGFTDDTVTRDEIRERILSNRGSDGAGRGRISHRLSQASVRGELAG